MLKEQSSIEKTIKTIEDLENSLKSAREFLELASEDEELQREIGASLSHISDSIQELQMECVFSGEADSNDCFLEIHAGAGGTESHDWAEMLYRMYLRFADKYGFKVSSVDELHGEEAGIKSVTVKVSGHNAFGWLRTESGVHRLVRISPFNAAGKRQTSFASVWVYPVIDDRIEIIIPESELRIDTYRSSGAGGQHVNTTDSAVRITHIPTRIAVQCQSDRSQHRNKAEAMEMLRAKLYEVKLREKEQRANEDNAKKSDNSWGNQIRSYVLHPYQMVKDHRSEFESSDTRGILDGELKEMIFASLVHNTKSKNQAKE